MKTDKITVFDLFQKQMRYLVPIFQRGYVWTKDAQWKPLWEDIAEQADLVQSHGISSRNTIRRHFLGAIVLSQVPGMIKRVAAAEIIDGQQRLLTLQVFLTAFKDAVNELGDDYLNTQLPLLTRNTGSFELEDQFKVWPTNAYQEEFLNVLTACTPKNLALKYPQRLVRKKLCPPRPTMVEAYFFFYEMINKYLNGIDTDNNGSGQAPAQPISQEVLRERANLLFEAVKNDLQLVEIELDAEDDPQVIFETLNYRGVALEPSDLIRNFIFLSADRQKKDVKELYNRWWKDFDQANPKGVKFWKEKERQGRLFHSRLDLFFFHHLTSLVGHDIKMGHLYQEYKDWWNGNEQVTVEGELEKAKRSSQVYQSLMGVDDNTVLGIFAQRLKLLDTSTVYPLLLWLCECRDKITPQESDGILADLESYIVRRAICRLTTKAYNRTCLTLLTKLKEEGLPKRETLRRELLALEGESVVWPDDEMFKQNLISQPLYDSANHKRARLVLTALELASRTSKQETEFARVPINNSLTVEHIMPQSFKLEEWPYAKSDPFLHEIERPILLHSLGNLTLLTQPLNSEESNSPFESKRHLMKAHSILILNNYFLDSEIKQWDENTIIDRGKKLADMAIKIWERPGK